MRHPFCCRRRAKRLKKLVRLMTGPVAQAPLTRMLWGTLSLMLVMLTVHIVCFAVFYDQVAQQHA